MQRETSELRLKLSSGREAIIQINGPVITRATVRELIRRMQTPADQESGAGAPVHSEEMEEILRALREAAELSGGHVIIPVAGGEAEGVI